MKWKTIPLSNYGVYTVIILNILHSKNTLRYLSKVMQMKKCKRNWKFPLFRIHDWGEWNMTPINLGWEIRECKICGKVQHNDVMGSLF